MLPISLHLLFCYSGHVICSEDKASGSFSHSRNVPGPVAIFWDIENCPIPKGGAATDIYCNARNALNKHHVLTGDIRNFCAYGDVKAFPSRLLDDLLNTGVGLFDISIRKKDSADKAILREMLFFAMDTPLPATIMLISGDVDFAPALVRLRERLFSIVLAVPYVTHVRSELTNAGDFVWHWPSLATGRFVEVPRNLVCSSDLQVLKSEIMYLLQVFNGHLKLSRIQYEYRIVWLKTLTSSDYGVHKLGDLMKNLGDPIRVWGRCQSDLLQDPTSKIKSTTG